MEEVSALIARSQEGDKGAREVLIEKNLGLVHHIVKRFAGRGYDMEDLFQIGTIGLMKAIDKFDLQLGLRFSTYAVPLITGEIKRFLRDDGPIKVSRSLKENAAKIKATRQVLQTKWNREPTVSELSKESGLTTEDIIMALEASATVESIYSSVSREDGNESYLVDKVVAYDGCVGTNIHAGDSLLCRDIEKERLLDHMLLKQLMEGLAHEERELIYMRYFQNKTQTEIAGILGVSQVQVSRMEKRILLRLREQAG